MVINFYFRENYYNASAIHIFELSISLFYKLLIFNNNLLSSTFRSLRIIQVDLQKQYIVQSITVASNNLRLTTQQIEVVSQIRDLIIKSTKLDEDIKLMKKITELSKFAIKLGEIYNFLSQTQVDMLKLSERFKEHSSLLINEINTLLNNVTPVTFKEMCDRIKKGFNNSEAEVAKAISVDLSRRVIDEHVFEKNVTEELKENIILNDEKPDDDFLIQNYENTILDQIKPLDQLLKKLSQDEFDYEQIGIFAELMKTNGELSAKIGSEIISDMHFIISNALTQIKDRKLMPGKEVIESIRACLIVIVAIVRGKDVDITGYLNRAEKFGNTIK